jgi:hypothetical protein
METDVKTPDLISYTLERPKTLSKKMVLFKFTFKACVLRRKGRFLFNTFRPSRLQPVLARLQPKPYEPVKDQ